MADEKKPKIDLKARLGKTAVGGVTPPGAAGIPAPAPSVPVPPGSGGSTAPSAIPAPTASVKAGGLPVPPGIPVGPPPAFASPPVNLDPSNPLAAAVGQPAPSRSQAPVAPPRPQRIEIDELTIQEARKGARKQGLIAGIVFGVVVGVVGFIAGGAQETNKGRQQAIGHAKSLADDVEASRKQLTELGDKLEAGRNTLLRDKKFPDTLAKDLGAINVDFDGSKLAGVRFSGFTQETTSGLIEYITAVQSTNDRKNALMGLLSKLQKPMTDMLEAQAAGKPPLVNFVVFIDKDGAKNPFGVIAALHTPIDLSPSMPAEFTATDLSTRKNVTVPKLTSLDKPGAAYIVPKSMEGACPSETSGQVGQLVSQLSRMITDVRGEAPAAGEAITEPKPGLIERADRLVTNLNKVN